MAQPPYPDEILKHCLACRQEKLHRRQALSSVALYACTGPCGFPGREVTDPWACTLAAKKIEAANLKAEQAKWKQQSDRERPLAPAVIREVDQILNPQETKMPKTNQSQSSSTPPLRAAIIKIVDEKIALALGGGLSREDVVQIVQEQLATALGTESEETEAEEPSSRSSRPAALESCRHVNRLKRCASCQAKP